MSRLAQVSCVKVGKKRRNVFEQSAHMFAYSLGYDASVYVYKINK